MRSRVKTTVPSSLAGVLLCAALLFGCSAPGTSGPLKLSSEDSGRDQTLSQGQTVSVQLKANPSTGYMWTVEGGLPAGLEQAGESAFETTSAAIGAGGIETWSFTAKSPGKGVLKMKYWRSFEPTAPPAATFEMPFTVK